MALVDGDHRVSVYERAPGSLAGQGIGIGTDAATMARLTEHGLIDRDFPRVDVGCVRYAHRGAGSEDLCWIGDVVRPAASFDWAALHRNLRGRMPDERYFAGHPVSARDTGPDIALDGVAGPVDLAVFADGYRSTRRHLVAPDARTDYLGLAICRVG